MFKKKENNNKKFEILRDSGEIKINGHENHFGTDLQREIELNKLISIIIMSSDQKIHFPIICQPTDKVNTIDTFLYKEYPELKETNFYYICKGMVLDRTESLNNLGIKNGDVVVLNEAEKSENTLINSNIFS